MSEPVKSVEIEDVLSSIRRLVSDDHRKVATQPDDTAGPTPDRLVLTAALRVPEDPEGSVDPTPTATDLSPAPLVLEPSQTASEDTDDARDEAQAGPFVHVDSADATAEPADTLVGAVLAHEEDGFVLSDPGDLDDILLKDDEPAAQLESEDGDLDAPWRDPEATLYGAAEFATVRTAEVTDDAKEDIRPLGEKIAALEEVIGRTEDQWEPDGTGIDDYAGTEVDRLDWEETEDDGAEARLTLEVEPVIEDASADVDDDAVADTVAEDDAALDEATLDEDALRALVADIVREELQGVLGERITRNVRKLVRREIQRALALKELD